MEQPKIKILSKEEIIKQEAINRLEKNIEEVDYEGVTEEIAKEEQDVAAAEKNADADGRDDAEKKDLKGSKIGLLEKGKALFHKYLERTEQKDGVEDVDGRTLRERKIEEYEKLGYKFDEKAINERHAEYADLIKEEQEKIKNKEIDVADSKIDYYKERIKNMKQSLYWEQMLSSKNFSNKDLRSNTEKLKQIDKKYAKIQMEARKLGQIKGILKLVDADSFGKKTEVKGKFPKRMFLKARNWMNSTDKKNGLVRSYNEITGRGTNKDFYDKLVKAQKLIGKDTASLNPDEVKLLKSIDLKRVSGALNEDVTRTSFNNTADGGNYAGTEIIDNTKANFTKKMEQIQQLDSRAMKMEGWNVINRLKIWAENPANKRRLASKIKIGVPVALLTGGLSNIGMLGSFGMFGARAVGALGGGEIFKGAYKKFATMPYQERAWNMRKEMIKNGDYLKNSQAGDIDSTLAKKINRDNFGQMAAYVPGAIVGALGGGGYAEMKNGGEFLDPTKRLLKMPGKAASFVKGLFTGETAVEGGTSVGNSNGVKTPETFIKPKDSVNLNQNKVSDIEKNIAIKKDTVTNGNEIIKKFKDSLAGTRSQLGSFKKSEIDLKEKLENLKLKPLDSLENQTQIENFQKQLDSIQGSNVELQAKIDDDALKLKQAENAKIKAEQDLGVAKDELEKTKSGLKNNQTIEKTKTSPYESFMEGYSVEESSKIRKGEGIYHALMRQTGNDKSRVMALLKKHDYIKYDSAGKLIKDVRVKDGMGAAYDLVKLPDGTETVIESVNGNPCHCDEFDVVEVKKACDASDLTTGKLERQEYVHTYTERPRVSVRVPDEVAREYEYLPHQNEIRTHTIEKHYITNTEYIKSEPEIRYVDRYIERPAPQEKITPKVREMVKQGRTRELRKMEERGEIKVEKKKGRFWKWLGRLGTDVLANEISYQIHKGDHGQDVIVCNHPSGGTVETGGQTDPIDGGHNPANGETGNTGNTNEDVTGGHNGSRRTGNGRPVPDDLEGGHSNTRETRANRSVTQKDLYEKENTRLRKERTTRDSTSSRRTTSRNTQNTNSRNSTSTRGTRTRSTRGTNSSSRGGTQRTTSTGKSGGVRGRSNRSAR